MQGTYIAAFFLFLIVIVLIPPISQLIENGLNFSLSGALRLVLVICLLIGFAVASPHTPSNTSAVQSAIAVPVSQNSGSTTPTSGSTTPKRIETTDTNVCYLDWTYVTSSSIGEYSKAPSGYSYAIVDLYLKNNADRSISTNPFDWSLTVDGIKYTPDAATYDSSVHSQSVEVGKGGEVETQIVYLVKGTPTYAVLKYSGFNQPDIQKIKHY